MELGARLQQLRFGLAAKLAVCLLLSSAAISAGFLWWNYRLHKKTSEEVVLQAADRASDLIQRSTRYLMMHNNRDALYQVIRDLGSEPGIRRIRIFNGEGRISFSTEPSEVHTVVDKQAESCYACHAQSQPLVRLARPDRARLFRDADGNRVLGVIRPIENQPSCQNAECHAHPASQQVLGVIDAHLSLAAVDEQLAGNRRILAALSVVAAALICAVSLVFSWVVVHRPIKELIRGTHRVGDGDLDHRIEVRSQDELGELAESFNKMTAELSEAHAEITEWARTLEERVERKTRELERAHSSMAGSEKLASLGKLAATVAHEVNNPLFGILTYARLGLRLLEKSELDESARVRLGDQLRVIERESKRCGDIMRNLLTFARQTPRKCDYNALNELVERSLALVRHRLEMQNVDLEKQLRADLPPVYCDAGQIQQVILALMVNAVEAMPKGGRLRVETGLDPAADAAQLTIADDGMGIPADVLPRIFEPFFTTKEDQHGTGLGLAVTQSILEQHGGAIAVSSSPGEGTQFVVTLPLEPLAALNPAAGASPGESKGASE